jgi:hypothetical protein
MFKRILFLFLFCLFLLSSTQNAIFAQTSVKGKVIDQSKLPLSAARVQLLRVDDSSNVKSTYTDSLGNYEILNFVPGEYYLKAYRNDYEPVFVKILVDSVSGLNLRKVIQLKNEIQIMKGGGIVAKRDAIVQKNDTVEFTSSNYKVNQDASAENLITKMPGITSENGTIKAQGEEIKKVTVDGQDFFGDDAAAALKNLPAEVVDKIQVFDRASDQSQFTGIDDGNSQKTLNIVTKSGKNNGQFGKIYGGYGTNERWAAGGNVNAFLGKHRLSFIGLSNNINQQNFSTQDILGTLGSSANSNRGGMGRPGGRGFGRNSDANNFLIGSQNGINTTNSFGVNYTGFAWTKLKLTASYFYNNGANNTSSFLTRSYFLPGFTDQIYSQGDTGENSNFSHRINARLEYQLDSNNSLIYKPSFKFQKSNSLSLFNAITENTTAFDTLNLSGTNSSSDASGVNLDHSILFRHRFKMPGQTLSLNLSQVYSNSLGNSLLQSKNFYYEPNSLQDVFAQETDNSSRSNQLEARLSYTQPLNKKSFLEFSYNPIYERNNSFKNTGRLDSATISVSRVLDTLLSSDLFNVYNTQKAGVTYRFTTPAYSFNFGADIQRVDLTGDQIFPSKYKFNRAFDNFLPNASFNYNKNKNSNLRISYRSRTSLPSISQLQNVVNNSNPLILSTGNDALKQEFTNMIFVRYSTTNVKKGRNFFVFGNVSKTDNYIGNSSFIAQKDTVLNEKIEMKKGDQLNMPVNLNGYRIFRSFMTFGLPVKMLKSTFNLNLGQTITRSPALINGAQNISVTSNTNAGLVLASNINEKIDFTLNYGANYNIVSNSIQSQSNSSYLIHSFNARANYLPFSWLVLNTDISNSTYTGLGSGFNQSIWLINAGIGYKFMKDDRAEVKLSVFDAFKQNNSISRSVTESYIEDKTTQILTRFYMLTFTYTIRNFKSGISSKGASNAPLKKAE